MTGFLTVYSWKGYLFKLGLVYSHRCDRCKQTSVTALHILGDCEALEVIRFRHLGHHVLKPVDFANISISKMLHLIQSVGVLNAEAVNYTKNQKWLRYKSHSCALSSVLSLPLNTLFKSVWVDYEAVHSDYITENDLLLFYVHKSTCAFLIMHFQGILLLIMCEFSTLQADWMQWMTAVIQLRSFCLSLSSNTWFR